MAPVRDRCRVIYPSIYPQVSEPRKLNPDKIVLTFVGAEWARKGGAAVARLGNLLKARRINYQINVISNLTYGEQIYTDTERSFYDEYVDLSHDDQIQLRGQVTNEEVLKIVSESDFSLLPTLDDSFGYSILESMALGVPVMATGICAIPEIIDHLQDGVLIPLPRDEIGRWIHVYTSAEKRKGKEFKAILRETIEQLAAELEKQVLFFLDNRELYQKLSYGAIQKISHRFNAHTRNREWHEIYLRALGQSP